MKLLEAGLQHSCVTLVDFAGILVPSSDILVLHRCSFFVVDPLPLIPLPPPPPPLPNAVTASSPFSVICNTVWLHTQTDVGDLQPWFSAFTCTHFVRLRVH